jgi:fructokinase
MKSIVGRGEILWDMLLSGKQLGGAPTYFAYHANALGNHGVVVSCVGDEELGHEIIEQLETLCLTCDYVAVDKTKPTGTVSIEI